MFVGVAVRFVQRILNGLTQIEVMGILTFYFLRMFRVLRTIHDVAKRDKFAEKIFEQSNSSSESQCSCPARVMSDGVVFSHTEEI